MASTPSINRHSDSRELVSGLPVIRPESAAGPSALFGQLDSFRKQSKRKRAGGRVPIFPLRTDLIGVGHFFSADCQFSTTIIGGCSACSTGASKRKRLPSGEAEYSLIARDQ